MSEPGLPDTFSLTKAQLSERKAVIGTLRLWSIFSVAVLVNYPWELAQARLYVGTDGADIAPWLCIVASLVDGALGGRTGKAKGHGREALGSKHP